MVSLEPVEQSLEPEMSEAPPEEVTEEPPEEATEEASEEAPEPTQPPEPQNPLSRCWSMNSLINSTNQIDLAEIDYFTTHWNFLQDISLSDFYNHIRPQPYIYTPLIGGRKEIVEILSLASLDP